MSAANPVASRPSRWHHRPDGHGRLGWWVAGGVVILGVSVLLALTLGPAGADSAAAELPPLSPGDVLASAAHHVGTWVGHGGDAPLSEIREAIIWQGRAPRILTAGCVGAGLALAGAVMQSVTRNPLADPYLLGLSSGASFGAVLVLLLGVSIMLPVAAFAGAMLALILTLALSGRGHAAPHRLVLAGVAVAQGVAALVSFLIFASAQGDAYRDILTWLMGSVAGASWSSVAIAAVSLGSVGTVLLASARTLDSFAFGPAMAASLGVQVARSRWFLLTVTALLTGALVSVSGSIGFIGLVFAHIVRLLVGSSHRWVLPLAGVGGAIFLIWADTAARSVFAPHEVPVGIVTAAIGAPVFAWLLARRSGRV